MKHNPFQSRTETTISSPTLTFECIYDAKHKAEILHRGTAYCRACYDQRNPYKTLIDS